MYSIQQLAKYLQFIFKYKIYVYVVVYTVHMISQNIDGGTTEADGEGSAPVGPSVATPLVFGPKFHVGLTVKVSAMF